MKGLTPWKQRTKTESRVDTELRYATVLKVMNKQNKPGYREISTDLSQLL